MLSLILLFTSFGITLLAIFRRSRYFQETRIMLCKSDSIHATKVLCGNRDAFFASIPEETLAEMV
jgi:hypothetical protein